MKVRVFYKYDRNSQWPYVAEVSTDSYIEVGVSGVSFDEAKLKGLTEFRKYVEVLKKNPPIEDVSRPESEEVELGLE